MAKKQESPKPQKVRRLKKSYYLAGRIWPKGSNESPGLMEAIKNKGIKDPSSLFE